MSVKLLTEHHLKVLSLKGGCTGTSESTLAKMPHCWKSHDTAHTCADAEGFARGGSTLTTLFLCCFFFWGGGCLHLSNCHIVGNHMSRLISDRIVMKLQSWCGCISTQNELLQYMALFCRCLIKGTVFIDFRV